MKIDDDDYKIMYYMYVEGNCSKHLKYYDNILIEVESR